MIGMRIRPAATTAALLVAVVAGVLLAVSLPPQAAAKGKPCWERVIDDWLDNGTIDQHYKTACLQQALKNVPEDLRDYSNLPDAIAAALQDSIRGGNGGDGSGTNAGSSSGGDGSGSPEGKDRTLQAAPPRSAYRRAIDKLGTTSADSLPIPLLVLAGLGTALLLSAGGLVTARRIRARRAGGAPPGD
jgi:hypothetical protein